MGFVRQEKLIPVFEAAASSFGRVKELKAREAEKVKEVGHAKYRDMTRPKLAGILNEIQQDEHKKGLGVFEKLLTVLVSEALPNSSDKELALTLETKAGLPSLDIDVAKDGEKEDITSGALNNVVSSGLRLISVARSGTRRFLIMDEPDCWMRPEQVQPFVNILGQVVNDLSLQMLLVSHHDASLFDGMFVVRLNKGKGNRLVTEIVSGTQKHDKDSDAFAWIRLINVKSHEDTTLPLSAGATVLIAKNDVGKSVFNEAFLAVFRGVSSDKLIRRKEASAVIEIGLVNGDVIRWQRFRDNKKQQSVELVDSDGNVKERTLGANLVPDWLQKIARMPKLDGVDVHINKPLSPVFLLDQGRSTRAKILSVGRETEFLRVMMEKNNEMKRADGSIIKIGEKEIAQIRDKVERSAAYSDLPQKLDTLRTMAVRIDEREESLTSLGILEEELSRVERDAKVWESKHSLSSSLPRAPELKPSWALDACMEDMVLYSRLEDFGDVGDIPPPPVLKDSLGISVAVDKLERLDSLPQWSSAWEVPSVVPVLKDTSELQRLLDSIVENEQTAKKAQESFEAAEKELAEIKMEIGALFVEAGGLCPLCGAPQGKPTSPVPQSTPAVEQKESNQPKKPTKALF